MERDAYAAKMLGASVLGALLDLAAVLRFHHKKFVSSNLHGMATRRP